MLNDALHTFQNSCMQFKQSTDRRVFRSCNNFGPLRSYNTLPMLTDFGSAEDVELGAWPIQVDAYRAPEVLLGWGWSKSADIWKLGPLV